MGLELEMDLELFFNEKIETNYHSFSFRVFFLHCSFTVDAERTFVALQFVHPITQK